jgi:hypothetical protein
MQSLHVILTHDTMKTYSRAEGRLTLQPLCLRTLSKTRGEPQSWSGSSEKRKFYCPYAKPNSDRYRAATPAEPSRLLRRCLLLPSSGLKIAPRKRLRIKYPGDSHLTFVLNARRLALDCTASHVLQSLVLFLVCDLVRLDVHNP